MRLSFLLAALTSLLLLSRPPPSLAAALPDTDATAGPQVVVTSRGEDASVAAAALSFPNFPDDDLEDSTLLVTPSPDAKAALLAEAAATPRPILAVAPPAASPTLAGQVRTVFT